jgi:predicted acyl esterase
MGHDEPAVSRTWLDVRVPMRDGVELSVDIFLPPLGTGEAGRWPDDHRNPNTDAPPGDDEATRPATQGILHDPAHPGHALLPVVPRDPA